jgi:DNA-directed RNA polymerase subunit RPC12/RpoP
MLLPFALPFEILLYGGRIMINKTIVRCRCGHQVLAKEVLRTDLYERALGREYVYVKYRCRRCKRIGEAFVAESRWDWSILEPAHNEMSDSERDQFLDEDAISTEEVLEFHRRLEDMGDLQQLRDQVALAAGQSDAAAETETVISSEPAEEPIIPRADAASELLNENQDNPDTAPDGDDISIA